MFGVNMGCKDQKGKELVSYRSCKPAVRGLFELLLYLNVTEILCRVSTSLLGSSCRNLSILSPNLKQTQM